MEFAELDVTVRTDGDGTYLVQANSAHREASGVFHLPWETSELNAMLASLRVVGESLAASTAEIQRRLGGGLVELFGGEVGALVDVATTDAAQQGRRLRLRLHLSEAPGLIQLPWELVYDDRVGFWALAADRSIVRVARTPGPSEPLLVLAPLQMLLVVAAPSNLPTLDVDKEQSLVERALETLARERLIQVRPLVHATADGLRRALNEAPVHLVHFIGHGEFDPASNRGWMALEDDEGRSDPVSAEALANLLRGHDVRLVVLNACEGAISGPEDPFAGVAPALSRRGVPAVVAVQAEVTDDAAVRFASVFYEELARGEQVDSALTESRRALAVDDSEEWWTPVLYLATEDGRLFDIPGTAAERRARAAAGAGGQWPVVVATAISGLVAVLTVVNQAVGVVTEVSVATAVVSMVAGLAFALFGRRWLIRRMGWDAVLGPIPVRRLVGGMGVALIAAGVVPFAVHVAVARQAREDGYSSFDRQRYAAALAPLERAERSFESMGLEFLAQEVRISLIQTHAALGEWDRAEAMVAEVRGDNLDRDLEGSLLVARATLALGLGQLEEAEILFQQAHQVVIPGSETEARLLFNEAAMLAERGGEFDRDALELIEEARRLNAEHGDRLGEAYALALIGDLERNPLTAADAYGKALSIAEEHDDLILRASLLHRLGQGLRDRGDFEQAAYRYDESLAAYREAAEPEGQALVYLSKATLEVATGNQAVAGELIVRAESLLDVLAPPGNDSHARTVAKLRATQAGVVSALGDNGRAEDLYGEALQLYAEHPSPVDRAAVLLDYGGLLITSGRQDEAQRRLEEAAALIEAFSGGKATNHLVVLESNLARLDQESGDLESARGRNERALALAERAGDPLLIADMAVNLGLVEIQLGERSGLDRLVGALDVWSQFDIPDRLAETQLFLLAVEELVPLGAEEDELTRSERTAALVQMVEEESLSRSVEIEVLTTVLPFELGDLSGLPGLEERLRRLATALEREGPPGQLGRVYLQLSRVATSQLDYRGAVHWAELAEPYAHVIPRLQRGPFHQDLGFAFFNGDEPARSLPHLWEAYFLLQETPASGSTAWILLVFIEQALPESLDEIDRHQQLQLVDRALTTTSDPSALELLESIRLLLEG